MNIPVTFIANTMAGTAKPWPINPDLAATGAVLIDRATEVTAYYVRIGVRNGPDLEIQGAPGAHAPIRQVGDLLASMAANTAGCEITWCARNGDFAFVLGDVVGVHVEVSA